MTRKVEDLAEKLGAEVVGTVPDYSAGAFGVAKLGQMLRERLEPSHGKRPDRPTNPRWSKRSKVPLAERLEQLARMLAEHGFPRGCAMKKRSYRTITCHQLDLAELGQAERNFLGTVRAMYEGAPECTAFAGWRASELRAAGLSRKSAVYRFCQDLEARLGIAQGKLAAPDYRDYLADVIEERYGARYRFCEETGVDPGNLSRVLSSQSELWLQNLQRILDALPASLVIQPEEDLSERVSPERGARDLAGAAR